MHIVHKIQQTCKRLPNTLRHHAFRFALDISCVLSGIRSSFLLDYAVVSPNELNNTLSALRELDPSCISLHGVILFSNYTFIINGRNFHSYLSELKSNPPLFVNVHYCPAHQPHKLCSIDQHSILNDHLDTWVTWIESLLGTMSTRNVGVMVVDIKNNANAMNALDSEDQSWTISKSRLAERKPKEVETNHSIENVVISICDDCTELNDSLNCLPTLPIFTLSGWLLGYPILYTAICGTKVTARKEEIDFGFSFVDKLNIFDISNEFEGHTIGDNGQNAILLSFSLADVGTENGEFKANINEFIHGNLIEGHGESEIGSAVLSYCKRLIVRLSAFSALEPIFLPESLFISLRLIDTVSTSVFL